MPSNPQATVSAVTATADRGKLAFNADLVAIALALLLAALVRFGVVPHVGW